MILLDPPAAVLDLVTTLEGAGYEAWCVGGAIRDALLGHRHLDWDLATSAAPEQVQRLFRRTVPIGIRFGTVGVIDRSGHMHEVTTFRRDVETDGRHAVVTFGATLDEDLARRDFTINAIAYSPSRQEVHDPFDGRGDLGRRVIRTVGDARDRMREDRLRALRAIRFAARFDFDIDPDTWAAVRESAQLLSRLSPERVRQELEKTMDQVATPSHAIDRWESSGALATLIPALVGTPAVLRAAVNHLPMPGPSRRPQRRISRLAALFLGVPADSLTKALKDLRFSNSDAAWISELVGRWQSLGAEMEATLLASEMIAPATARRWAALTGRTRLAPLMRLAAAAWAAQAAAGMMAPEPARVRAAYRVLVRTAYRDPIEIADLAVDGEDLAGAGIAPGPQVGKILRSLLAIVLGDPAKNTRDELLARAAVLARSPDHPMEG